MFTIDFIRELRIQKFSKTKKNIKKTLTETANEKTNDKNKRKIVALTKVKQ